MSEKQKFESCRSDHFSLKIAPSNGAKPVAHPDASDRIEQALGRVAEALLAVANALQGRFVSNTPQNPPVAKPVWEDDLTVRQVLNEFLSAKARQNKSDRYLRQLRASIGTFSRAKGGMMLKEVTRLDVEKWIQNKSWSGRTQRGYLGDLKTLFNFAIKRGYLAADRATCIELAEDRSRVAPVEIHTPAQVKAVLECARKADLDVCRHLAVRYFAGLRSAEAHKLTEENILADRGYIEVPAVKAKTRRRRLVKIQPVLEAWLALGGELRPIGPMTVRKVIKLSGVNWPKNVTRHSFVSYHIAKFESAAKTAIEAGHSEEMLFEHYRALVTAQAAEEFWGLFPSDFKKGFQPGPSPK